MTQPAKIVFCDFDGTITAQETFVAVLKRYAPELAAELIPQMYALQIPLREGVRRILESIPSAVYPEILNFARAQPHRPGLPEFLAFLDEHQVPFVVISGGLQGMVAASLDLQKNQTQAIYGLEVEASGDRLRVSSPAVGETDFVDKVTLMKRHPADWTIAIGDSVTDLNMALAADAVFARDRLAQYLDERQVPYQCWNDFHEIQQILTQQWSQP